MPERDFISESLINQKGFSDTAPSVNSNELRPVPAISAKQFFLLLITSYHRITPILICDESRKFAFITNYDAIIISYDVCSVNCADLKNAGKKCRLKCALLSLV